MAILFRFLSLNFCKTTGDHATMSNKMIFYIL